MANLINSFALTTITSGSMNKKLNVLQVQTILEANIVNCKVIGVIPKETCTLIRMSINNSVIDVAIAANSVAVKSNNHKQKLEYTGDLVETVLNIINSLDNEISAKRDFEQVINNSDNDAMTKAIAYEIKKVVTESGNVAYAKVVQNISCNQLAKEVILERMVTPNGDLHAIICKVLNRKVKNVS